MRADGEPFAADDGVLTPQLYREAVWRALCGVEWWTIGYSLGTLSRIVTIALASLLVLIRVSWHNAREDQFLAFSV